MARLSAHSSFTEGPPLQGYHPHAKENSRGCFLLLALFVYEHRVMANKVRKVIGRWQGTTIFTTMRKWRHYVLLLNSRMALIRKVIM